LRLASKPSDIDHRRDPEAPIPIKGGDFVTRTANATPSSTTSTRIRAAYGVVERLFAVKDGPELAPPLAAVREAG
jgi:hypothetical protein